MENLEKAKSLLLGETTLVLCNSDSYIKSTKRGVAPLLEIIDNGTEVKDWSAADKVVGKAAAFLYATMQVKEVFAVIISKSAKRVFEKYNIPVSYEMLVPYISNRDKTGMCPMEKATWDTENKSEAEELIRNKYKELCQQKNA